MAFDGAIGDLVFRPGAHLSMNYFLDTTDRVSRWLGRDVVDSMVFLAILGENFGDQASRLTGDFRTLSEDRKPVSITALARILDMPYETVRRHAIALQAAGFCRKQKGGYLAKTHMADRLNLDDLLSGMTGATRQLLDNLAQVGAPLPSTCQPERLEPVGCSAPMAIRYYVEGMAGLCRTLNMDVVRAVILLTIVRRNHLAFENGLRTGTALDAQAQWFTDPMRQSVSTYCVAKTLRLPYETVRRHCRALRDQGLVECDEKGQLLVTGRLLETQKGQAAAGSAWASVRSFMEALARVGVPMPGPAFA
jgi:DNA-binding transcriptional ArsR family regulator